MDVLLQRGVDDLLDRAVVPEVDHFGAGTLQHPANDVDRGVVAVEQACRGNEANGAAHLGRTRRFSRARLGLPIHNDYVIRHIHLH